MPDDWANSTLNSFVVSEVAIVYNDLKYAELTTFYASSAGETTLTPAISELSSATTRWFIVANQPIVDIFLISEYILFFFLNKSNYNYLTFPFM